MENPAEITILIINMEKIAIEEKLMPFMSLRLRLIFKTFYNNHVKNFFISVMFNMLL